MFILNMSVKMVLFTHCIAWRRGSSEGGNCNTSTVAAATLIGGGELACRCGCSGTIGSLQYQCTDFSLSADWSAGQGSNTVTLNGVTSFEASYTGGVWIALLQGGGNWEIRVKGSLAPRPDNGRINSSPVTAVFPVVRLHHGATHTITIPVSDADGDVVRCRWAESALSECAGVCQTFPATLDEDNCILTYNANGALGWYAAALQVEDFINASSTVAMSSVPVQFLMQVQNITAPSGMTAPTFVRGTPVSGSCIPVNGTYQQQIIARSGGDSASIADITTVSPPGLMRSPLTALNSRESYIDVTWTPSPSQQGAHIFCYIATDNFGLTPPQTCVTLLVEVEAPELTSVVLTSFRNGTFELSLQYAKRITMPSTGLKFVNVSDNNGMQVLSVDVSTSTDAVYSGDTLTITTSTSFYTNRMYYLLADSACPGPPLNLRLASPVPPSVEVQWDGPTTPDMWSFMYLIDWQNGTSAVGDTTDTLSGLEAVTQYTVTITAFTDSTVCVEQSANFTFNTTQICPVTGPQVELSPEILPGTATITWQAAQTSDPVLITGMLYAVYSLCGSESRSYQLVAEAIEGLSYTVTGLPAPAQCTLRVVAYHRYCLQDLDGVLRDQTLPFTTAIEAPEQPPPPTVTVGINGFTIAGLGPMEVVVEYVCNYTSVITEETVQVRMKPNETADVSLEKVGGYIVQCAGVNGDNYLGAFSEPVAITVEPPETQEGSPQRRSIDPLVVSLSVAGVVVVVTLLAVLTAAVIWAKMRRQKTARQGDVRMDTL